MMQPRSFSGGGQNTADRTKDAFRQLPSTDRHRSEGRKILDGETWVWTRELPERLPRIDRGIIQQYNDWTAPIPLQLP
jgi:hypothetical protein